MHEKAKWCLEHGRMSWRGNGKNVSEMLELAEPALSWDGLWCLFAAQIWKLLLSPSSICIISCCWWSLKESKSLLDIQTIKFCFYLGINARNWGILNCPAVCWSCSLTFPLHKPPVEGPSSYLLPGHWRHLGPCRQPLNHSNILHVIFINLPGIFLLQL